MFLSGSLRAEPSKKDLSLSIAAGFFGYRSNLKKVLKKQKPCVDIEFYSYYNLYYCLKKEEYMDKRENLFRNEPVLKAILKLALPSIAGMVIMAIYTMADTYFVSISPSGMVGTAAVSLMMPILMIGQAIAMLFAVGGSATVSRLMGEGKQEEANKISMQTLTFIAAAGVVMTIVGLVLGRPLLFAFGASEETIGPALDFGIILFIFAPVQMLNMGFNNLLRAEGSAIQSMMGMLVGALLNIAFEPLFIFTFNMGIFGAGLATSLAQTICFFVFLSNYLRKKTVIRLEMRSAKPQNRVFKTIFRIGFATFCSQILVSASFALINIFAKPYGDNAIAAFGIANRLQFLGIAIIFGLCMGYQPMAGFNYGAKLFDRLHKAIVYGILLMLITGGALAVIFNVFAPNIVGGFTTNAYVLELGTEVMQYCTIVFPFIAFTVLMLVTCQSLNRPASALILSVGRQGVVLIPVMIVLVNTLGLKGLVETPLYVELISVVISILIAVFIFRKLREEHVSYMKDKPLADAAPIA